MLEILSFTWHNIGNNKIKNDNINIEYSQIEEAVEADWPRGHLNVRLKTHNPRLSKLGLTLFASLFLLLFGLCYSAKAGQTFIVSGVNGGPENVNAFHGVVHSFKGNLSENGPIARLFGKTSTFFFESDLPGGLEDVEIQALRFGVQADVGWQLANDHARIALLAGVVWREHDLNPVDPTSSLLEEDVGFSITLDGDYRFSDRFGIAANANFVTEFDEVWTQIKPYARIKSKWKIGPQFAFAAGPEFTNGRAGIFISDFEYTLPVLKKKIYFGLEAGAQFDIEDERVEAFGGVNAGYEFTFFRKTDK